MSVGEGKQRTMPQTNQILKGRSKKTVALQFFFFVTLRDSRTILTNKQKTKQTKKKNPTNYQRKRKSKNKTEKIINNSKTATFKQPTQTKQKKKVHHGVVVVFSVGISLQFHASRGGVSISPRPFPYCLFSSCNSHRNVLCSHCTAHLTSCGTLLFIWPLCCDGAASHIVCGLLLLLAKEHVRHPHRPLFLARFIIFSFFFLWFAKKKKKTTDQKETVRATLHLSFFLSFFFFGAELPGVLHLIILLKKPLMCSFGPKRFFFVSFSLCFAPVPLVRLFPHFASIIPPLSPPFPPSTEQKTYDSERNHFFFERVIFEPYVNTTRTATCCAFVCDV